jgi:hypothetical protein
MVLACSQMVGAAAHCGENTIIRWQDDKTALQVAGPALRQPLSGCAGSPAWRNNRKINSARNLIDDSRAERPNNVYPNGRFVRFSSL